MMKKAFISADIEGVEGVVSTLQIMRAGADYQLARRRLTLDVNAAVRACFDSGCEGVLVCDGHADCENLLIDELDPRALLCSGSARDDLQMEGIDESFGAYISFGHAGEGLDERGVASHCFSARKVRRLWLGSRLMNMETEVDAHIAGLYGIPLVAFIGDEAAAKQVAAFSPETECAVVKWGVSRFSAISMQPERARELIYETVRRGLARADAIPALKLGDPLEMKLEFMGMHSTDAAMLVPGMVREDTYTVSYTGSPRDIFRLLELLINRVTDIM